VPAELVIKFKAATQKQSPGYSRRRYYGASLTCRIAGVNHTRVLCTAMHTFSRFVRSCQRLCAAFSTVPVGNQIAESACMVEDASAHDSRAHNS
jgi:hypothetical protein